MPARPGGAFGPDDDVSREIADVRPERGRAAAAMSGRMVPVERPADGDRGAVDSCDLDLLVAGRERPPALRLAKLPRVREDDPVARRPALQRTIECERRLRRTRITRQPREGRRLDGAVHPDPAQPDDAVPDLPRIELQVERAIGDLNFRARGGRNRPLLGADVELPVFHDDQRHHRQLRPAFGVERQPSADLDTLHRVGGLDVVRDLPPRRNQYFRAGGRHRVRRPRRRRRPASVGHGAWRSARRRSTARRRRRR